MERSPDTLLLDIVQKISSLQGKIDILLEDRERYSVMHVASAEMRQTLNRLEPIVDRLNNQSQQAVGVMWFGRVIWALIGGGVLTAVGWAVHLIGKKFGG